MCDIIFELDWKKLFVLLQQIVSLDSIKYTPVYAPPPGACAIISIGSHWFLYILHFVSMVCNWWKW